MPGELPCLRQSPKGTADIALAYRIADVNLVPNLIFEFYDSTKPSTGR